MSTDTVPAGPRSVRWDRTTAILVGASSFVALVTVLLSVVPGLPTAVRLPLALPVLVVLPGYAVVTALFPPTGGSSGRTDVPGPPIGRDAGASSLERLVLSVVLSLAIVPMVALVVTLAIGLQLWAVLLGVTGVTAVASALASYRRRAYLASKPVAEGSGGWGFGRLRSAVPTDWLTLVAVAVTLLLLASTVGVLHLDGSAPSPMTEFYVVNQTGQVGPVEPAGGAASFDLRIVQHADAAQRFTVVVMVSTDAGDNSPAAWREVDRLSTVARPDETARLTYRADVSSYEPGTVVHFLLYRDPAPATADPATAVRQLRVSLTDAGTSTATA